MKIRFLNAGSLIDGISYVAPDLGIELSECADALTVNVCEVEERIASVSLSGGCAEITYGDGRARFFRGLAKLVGWIGDGIKEKTETERPLFAKNGAMFSESRGVMRVESVKATMRAMALMGQNTYMLYTEDTYEIDGYPSFGHARGRYSKDELKELDKYALALGIELIPCIQVLGHLQYYLKQASAAPHRDTANVLLVGSEETYKLIDAMFASVSECFTTRRVHIGMDETKDLGTGAYLAKHGYREKHELFFEHLERVRDMARARGLDPMMWSDMFFRLAGRDLPAYCEYDMRLEFTDDYREMIPQGVRQVFWDYYNSDKEFYRSNIEKHRSLFDREPIFAGGIWLWSGEAPLYSRSFKFTYPALDACRETNLQEIFATIWGGDDSQLMLAMPGLAWYADYDYVGGYDEESVKRTLRYACEIDYDTFMLAELPQHPHGLEAPVVRALTFNDPLLGIADSHLEGLPMGDYYRETAEKLEASKPSHPLYAPAYELIIKLSRFLEYKADFGVRLKLAYDRADRGALGEFITECDVILERLHELRDCHYGVWMKYNKPNGWEVHDIRYGGLVQRFDTAKRRLSDYLEGRTDRLEELEEERLPLCGRGADGEAFNPDFFLWHRYASYATKNII